MDLLFSVFLHGTKELNDLNEIGWLAIERTAATGWIQRKDKSSAATLLRYSCIVLTHALIQIYWTEYVLKSRAVWNSFLYYFPPYFLTFILIHKKPEQAPDELLLDWSDIFLFVTNKPKPGLSVFNSGFWGYVLLFDMKEWMPKLFFE